jgi:hypothetical protein
METLRSAKRGYQLCSHANPGLPEGSVYTAVVGREFGARIPLMRDRLACA